MNSTIKNMATKPKSRKPLFDYDLVPKARMRRHVAQIIKILSVKDGSSVCHNRRWVANHSLLLLHLPANPPATKKELGTPESPESNFRTQGVCR